MKHELYINQEFPVDYEKWTGKTETALFKDGTIIKMFCRNEFEHQNVSRVMMVISGVDQLGQSFHLTLEPDIEIIFVRNKWWSTPETLAFMIEWLRDQGFEGDYRNYREFSE